MSIKSFAFIIKSFKIILKFFFKDSTQNFPPHPLKHNKWMQSLFLSRSFQLIMQTRRTLSTIFRLFRVKFSCESQLCIYLVINYSRRRAHKISCMRFTWHPSLNFPPNIIVESCSCKIQISSIYRSKILNECVVRIVVT
jgi:hypothetical protein